MSLCLFISNKLFSATTKTMRYASKRRKTLLKNKSNEKCRENVFKSRKSMKMIRYCSKIFYLLASSSNMALFFFSWSLRSISSSSLLRWLKYFCMRLSEKPNRRSGIIASCFSKFSPRTCPTPSQSTQNLSRVRKMINFDKG